MPVARMLKFTYLFGKFLLQPQLTHVSVSGQDIVCYDVDQWLCTNGAYRTSTFCHLPYRPYMICFKTLSWVLSILWFTGVAIESTIPTDASIMDGTICCAAPSLRRINERASLSLQGSRSHLVHFRLLLAWNKMVDLSVQDTDNAVAMTSSPSP